MSGGSFGFSLAPISPETRAQLGLKDGMKGALIAAVESGSPADEQGLRAGDVLQQVGREAVDSPKEAAAKLLVALTRMLAQSLPLHQSAMSRKHRLHATGLRLPTYWPRMSG